MRQASLRSRGHADEEESVFISMTDLTVSFLFIVIILLAFFASQFRSIDQVPKEQLDAVNIKLAEKEQRIAQLENQLSSMVSLKEFNEIKKELINAKIVIDRMQRERELFVPREELDAAKAASDRANALIVLLKRRLEQTVSLNEFNRVRTALLEAEAQLNEMIKELEKLRALRASEISRYGRAAENTRRKIILQLKSRVEAAVPELKVTVSDAGDILRFEGDAFFNTGKYIFRSRRIEQVVDAVADGLSEILPCFTLGEFNAYSPVCNPDAVLVDAVQIEGHTDAVGNSRRNLNLSLDRGATTFQHMDDRQNKLLRFLNLARQPVLSVAGYGETRPVAPDTPSTRSLNRRIDLRFIMASVLDVAEIDQIREQLSSAAESAFRNSD